MVKLRLRRMGRKKLAIYKVVAADSRSPRDGRFIESVGEYNPNTNPANIKFNESRVFYWLKNGAKPTDTVRSLLSHSGILLKWNLKKKGLDTQKIDEEFAKWSAAQENKLRKKHERKQKRKAKKKKTSEKKTDESAAVKQTTSSDVQTDNAPPAGDIPPGG